MAAQLPGSNPIAPDPYAILMPLRERDLQALVELFQGEDEDMEAIEADIHYNLTWRSPEPCWEDDPFEFLRDYL